MNNTTSTIYPLIVNNDSIGAIIFIVVVLLWYSSSIIFLLGMQIGITSNELADDSAQHPTKLFVETLRDQTNSKEILKELVDRQKRDKLWDIYLGKSTDMNDKISRDEIHRIRNIEKRLATLNEDGQHHSQRLFDDSFISRSNSSLWSSVTDGPSSNLRLRVRRRSSLDNKIIREWKILGDELKTHENWPWTIQKLLIRRRLKRQRCTSDCPADPHSSNSY